MVTLVGGTPRGARRVVTEGVRCFACKGLVERPGIETTVSRKLAWCACGHAVCRACGREMLTHSDDPEKSIHVLVLEAPRCPYQRDENAHARRTQFLVLEGGRVDPPSDLPDAS